MNLQDSGTPGGQDGGQGGAADGGQPAGASAADLLGGAPADTGDTAGSEVGGEGGGGADQGAADPDWYQQLSADADGEQPSLRDWAKSIGAKDVNQLAKIARDNQRALRENGRVKVPGDDATAEEISAFRAAIGVPESAKDYKRPQVAGENGEPVALNSAKIDTIAGIAHEEGLPAKAFERVLQRIAEADAQELATVEADIQQRAEAHAAKWGAARAENTTAVGRALEALGVTRDEALAIRAAISPERALDIFAKLGAGLGEDTMVEGGGRQRFGLSGAEAQKQLDARMKDDGWRSRAMRPGTAERAEYDRLNNAIGVAADRKMREEA